MVDKLFSSDDCYDLTNKEVRELYKKYVNPSLEQLFGAFAAGREDVDHSEGVWILFKKSGSFGSPTPFFPNNPLIFVHP